MSYFNPEPKLRGSIVGVFLFGVTSDEVHVLSFAIVDEMNFLFGGE